MLIISKEAGHISNSTLKPTNTQPRRALFLDRDGVINVNHGYVHKKANFDFIDNIFNLVKSANKLDYAVIVVTNQSGIGRGLYTQEDFNKLTSWMLEEFMRQGAHIDKVYFCPHHPSAAKGHYLQQCECRKPDIGMLEQAQSAFNLDLQHSIMVGDKQSDVECAINAKLHKVFLLQESQQTEILNLALNTHVVHVQNLKEIVLV